MSLLDECGLASLTKYGQRAIQIYFKINVDDIGEDSYVKAYFPDESEYAGYWVPVDLSEAIVDNEVPNKFHMFKDKLEKVIICNDKGDQKTVDYDSVRNEMWKRYTPDYE